MTAQLPDRFVNDHPRVDVAGLRLYFVSAELPVQPWRTYLCGGSLWRGYVATWRLDADGTLELLQFEYPEDFDEDADSEIQLVEHGLVDGDFHLTFRTSFYGSETVIPFVDGRVIEDRSRWTITERLTPREFLDSVEPGDVRTGRVTRRVKGGFLVDIGRNAFLSDEHVPEPTVGQEGRWLITTVDRERMRVVVVPFEERDRT